MADGKPDRTMKERRTGRWAAVHLVVASLLILGVAAVRLRASLADSAGLSLPAGIGVLALLPAGLLFRSFLRR
ncbi:MAG: hypothetical protein ACLFV8_04725 [Alphaproteobacteria bacterium]